MAVTIKIIVSDAGGGGFDNIKKDISEIDRAASKASGGGGGLGMLGSSLKVLGGVALGVAAGGIAAFGAAVVSGIGDARESAKLLAQTEAVIKSTGGAAGVSAQHIVDYASALSDAAGKSLFGDDQIQQSENLLLTFTNIKDKTLDAATAISVDMAQALGGAPKDQAIQLGKALNDPIQGISALTRVGVTFSDEQKNMIKAMQNAGNTAGAQKVILDELNKEFGGSAEAATKATGGWSEFKGRMGEAAETVGTAILPLLNQLSGFLVTTIAPAIERAATAMSAWLADPAVQANIAAIGNAITTGLGAAFTWLSQTAIPELVAGWALLQPAIAAVIGAFQSGGESAGVLGEIVAGLQSRWQAFYGALQQIVAGVLAVVTAVFKQVSVFLDAHGSEITATLTTAWRQINEIINTVVTIIGLVIGTGLKAIASFIDAHGTQIQAILSAAWKLISSIITTTLGIILGVVKAALQLLQGNWSGAWETIKTASATFVQGIYQIIVNGLNLIASFFGTSLNEIGQIWQNNWNMLVSILSTIWERIKSTISTAISHIKSAFTNIDWGGIGNSVIQGIAQGIKDGVHWLIEAAEQAAQDAYDAAMRKIKGGSPAQLFVPIGTSMVQGMALGLTQTAPLVAGAAAYAAGAGLYGATSYVNSSTRNTNITYAPRYSSSGAAVNDVATLRALAGV